MTKKAILEKQENYTKNRQYSDHSINLQEQTRGHVLVVDDDLDALELVCRYVRDAGFQPHPAHNGQEALDKLASLSELIDVVLMDRMMPTLDGLTTFKLMEDNRHFYNIPVVMMTGASAPEQVGEGIEAGLFYYLTKPLDPLILESVLYDAQQKTERSQALFEELNKHKSSFSLIKNCKVKFRTPPQAYALSAFLANCFDEPDRVVAGIAELMLNAIEHGNLDIGFERKKQALQAGNWPQLLNDRLEQKSNINKFAEAVLTHKEDGIYLVITDQGNGFDWRNYMMIDPTRAGEHNGRGIATARTVAFDRLGYNETGNQLIAFSASRSDLKSL